MRLWLLPYPAISGKCSLRIQFVRELGSERAILRQVRSCAGGAILVDMTDNEQKVAIITGSSQGIGAGLTAAYRDRGWAVVGNSLTGKPSDDPEVLVIDGDVSEPGTSERIVTGALERFGRIDTLVNNAGLFISKPFTDYTAADYALVVGVNLTGFFMLTQRVIAEMLERGGGHVVNITTTLVDYADSTQPTALTALTKGGLAAATRSLAIEYATRGIRVNAISPGVIQSSMRDPEAYEALGAQQPMGRVGQVRDVVDGVLFLESSPFITGEIIHIDGGRIAGH
jgi:NAD(P)-dependent dehydrogenase (short-subunit alcohol dehydrogenase family)